MNKKGLASGLIIVTIVLFIFALSSLFALKMWNEFNSVIQNTDNSTINPLVKEKIDNLGSKMLWGDKLFTIFMIMLMIAFMISSATIPVNEPIYIIFYGFILIGTTFVAMIMSNSWTYILSSSLFSSIQSSFSFTDFFMKYFPIIVFIIGLIGGLLFYGRKQGFIGSYQGNIDGIE